MKTILSIIVILLISVSAQATATPYTFEVYGGSLIPHTTEPVTCDWSNWLPASFYGTTIFDGTSWGPVVGMWFVSGSVLTEIGVVALFSDYIGIQPDHVYSQVVHATPIPSTLIMLGTGLAGLAGFRRKTK